MDWVGVQLPSHEHGDLIRSIRCLGSNRRTQTDRVSAFGNFEEERTKIRERYDDIVSYRNDSSFFTREATLHSV